MTTQFQPNHQLHALTDSSFPSYGISGVRIEPGPKGYVTCVATNSKSLAVVKAPGTCDAPTIAPAACFKWAANTKVTVTKNKTWSKVSDSLSKKGPPTTEDLGKGFDSDTYYPRWRNGLPDLEKGHYFEVTLNPVLLIKLARALGCDEKDPSYDNNALTLFVPYNPENLLEPCDAPIPVLQAGKNSERQVGVIAPFDVSETASRRDTYTKMLKKLNVDHSIPEPAKPAKSTETTTQPVPQNPEPKKQPLKRSLSNPLKRNRDPQ